MSALGSKWKPIIVLVIKDRTLRFGEIAARISVISRKVLTAAALTYVAALVMTILQLVRLIALRNMRRD